MNAEEIEIWRQADRIFAAWLEQDEPHRALWLQQQALATEIRAAVQKLVYQHHFGVPEFTALQQVALLRSDSSIANNQLAGRQIGHWLLIEEIGRGGMAVVYKAKRIGVDFEQLAAVKLLSLAALGAQGSARFEQERRVLARLRHPHIASLIDGGFAEDGTPYLVMSLIEGETLARYCEHHRLDWRACVRLMIAVCDAVAHAHHNFLVHRDLKPTNILVTDQGTPVLLDFGIAKLLDDTHSDTRTGMRALTPGYAAPEQIEDGPITTATDVYALGVILRALCAPTTALPHDLHNIIEMALREDATRRYPDARTLGDDLRRLLAQRPVQATPDSNGYRLRAFLRRQRGLVAAIAAVALALVLGLGLALWQAERASRQAKEAMRQAARADAARDFLLTMIETGDRERTTANDPPISTVIARGIATLQAAPISDPDLHAEMATLLGHLDTSIGQYQRAAKLLGSALHSAERVNDDALIANVWVRQGILANATGKPDQALGLFNAAIEKAASLNAERRAKLLIAGLGGWTYAMSNLGRNGQANTRLQATLDRQDLALTAQQRAELLMMQSSVIADPKAKLDLLMRVQQLHSDAAPSPADQLFIASELGSTMNALGRHQEAIEYLTNAAAIADRVHPGNTSRRARIYNNLGSLLANAGSMAAAETAYAQAEAIYRALGDQKSPAFASLIHNRGTLLRDLGIAERAMPLIQDAHTMAVTQFGKSDRRSLIALRNLAMASAEAGALANAETQYQQASQLLGTQAMPQDRYLLLLIGGHIAALAGDPTTAAQRIVDADALAASEATSMALTLTPVLRARSASIAGTILSLQSKAAEATARFEEAATHCAEGGAETWSAAWRNELAFAEHLQRSGEQKRARAHYKNTLALLDERGAGLDSRLRQQLRAQLR